MRLYTRYSEKEIKKLRPVVDQIIASETEMALLSDDELRAKTNEFKQWVADGVPVDDILPRAFAVVREAAWRVLRMKHYPVQILGGIILNSGRIAEMRTGEGKTLVSTLPAYLNALTGKGVHVVTVNEYLAKRDSEWMGKVYKFLGLTVGLVIPGMSDEAKRAAYACDITYCTNSELGFDYLRDNMVPSVEKRLQRGFNYAIVDEIDSILIDEARTPLIISGFAEESSSDYVKADTFIKSLKGITIVDINNEAQSKLDAIFDGIEDPYAKYEDYDYIAEEKNHTAMLTEKGEQKMWEFYGIEDDSVDEDVLTNIRYYVSVALKANTLYKKNVDYVVVNDEIQIVDLGTGRIMNGRRFSKGIHQGIEAKEGVKIKPETITMASITYQNFFRKYAKLSGMTGTAMTEEKEFEEIYGLSIVEVPTNNPIQRIDQSDRVFATEEAKLKYAVEFIKKKHETGQPILVGTASVEKSELLHKLLKKENLPHSVLNAKHHDREAEIIAQAGRFGSITIATNMAGRGTDIILGGNPEYMALKYFRDQGYDPDLIAEMTEYSETDNQDILNARIAFRDKEKEIKDSLAEETAKVKAAGGLLVVGTERHESRRIDNQLRGRSGRQGDVGESVFFLSLEDDLMRLFGVNRVSALMKKNLPEDAPIDAKILSNAIEHAQQNVEANHFAQRKRTLEYDMINSLVREGIYDQRNTVLETDNLYAIECSAVQTYLDCLFSSLPKISRISREDRDRIRNKIKKDFLGQVDCHESEDTSDGLENMAEFKNYVGMYICQMIDSAVEIVLTNRSQNVDGTEIRRKTILRVIDKNWADQMEIMDDIKSGVYLDALGKQDPYVKYRDEVYSSFEQMKFEIARGIIKSEATVLLLYRKAEQSRDSKIG